MNNLFIKKYDNIPINRDEILRYAGCPKCDNLPFLDECIEEIENKLSYKLCYRIYDICKTSDGLDLGFNVTQSRSLIKNLENCDKIILFAATIGFEIDRCIKKYTCVSPTKALLFQAIGTQQIEDLCDTFCDDLSNEYCLRPRFSPGYGDLPLEMQRDIFSVLDCSRAIGVSLNSSLLMSPTKSVTAIVGIIHKD